MIAEEDWFGLGEKKEKIGLQTNKISFRGAGYRMERVPYALKVGVSPGILAALSVLSVGGKRRF